MGRRVRGCLPLGPALCHPGRPVIRVVGDGGAVMTGGELAVGVARGANIKLLLSDNGSYASIRIH